MTGSDAMQLSVDSRFCGPPGAANGGYLCGLIGSTVGQTVTVRLNQPVPLETVLDLLPAGPDAWQLRHQGRVLAQVRSAVLVLDVPAPPSYVAALDASLHYIGFEQHPYPRCFVCGPDRAKHDGLRLFAGAVADAPLVAAGWLPDATLAGADGKVAPEFMSAALDCPGFFALRGVRPSLLGEFTSHVDRCVHVDEPCVVIGWRIEGSGRKHVVGTAVFDEDLEPCGYARGVWIESREAVAPT
jgi:hypothetical protein